MAFARPPDGLRSPAARCAKLALAARNLLFVYGTLRRGAPMHKLIEGRATWLGLASAAGCLVDLGAFPGLVPAQGPGDRVHGDLFTIADAQREELLDALDRYEGASFERVQQAVDGPGGPAHAWLYVYRGAANRRTVIDGGDYLAHSRRAD